MSANKPKVDWKVFPNVEIWELPSKKEITDSEGFVWQIIHDLWPPRCNSHQDALEGKLIFFNRTPEYWSAPLRIDIAWRIDRDKTLWTAILSRDQWGDPDDPEMRDVA